MQPLGIVIGHIPRQDDFAKRPILNQMAQITLACQKSPGHDLELGGASNKPEPVVERIANRLQLERALRALRAEGLHADHMN
jgi:hypothetical protein